MYEPTIKIGDLVYHLIHGKSWVAVVLDLTEVKNKCRPDKFCREYVHVHMQAGTRYEKYFYKFTNNTRITDSSGLVSYHWLRKITDGPYFMPR